MQTLRKPLYAIIFSILILLWFGIGCEDKDDTPVGPEDDCTTADSLVSQANDSLGSQMNMVINQTLDDPDSSFRPEDIDFSGVNNLYNQAVALCPTNLDAQFGAGFTGLLTYLTDPELNDLLDRIKYMADTIEADSKTPKPLNMLPLINTGGPLSPEAIPLHITGFTGVLPSLTALDYEVMATAATDPTIAEIQSNLETQLLPKIVSARTHLAAVLAVSTYTFTVTPAMQGNMGADPIIMDRTDFSVLMAVAYAADAALHVFFARNLDFTPISVEGLETAMTKSDDFLDLKSSGVGATHMATAKSRIASAKSALVDAIDYLMAEIGSDQTYDLIEIPDGGAADLNEAKDTLNYYYDYLVNQKEVDINVNGNDTTVTVDLKMFFDDPMENPKEFLPDYTITLEELDSLHIGFATAHFSRQAYWDSLQSIYGITYPNDTPYFDNHLPDANDEEFYRLIGEYGSYYVDYGRQQFVFGWDDVQNYCTPTDPWCYWSNNMSRYTNHWYDRDELTVGLCYSWDDNSFAEWTWPDPTFNGLLPGMTEDQLKELIFGDGSEWEKSACDTIETDDFDDF